MPIITIIAGILLDIIGTTAWLMTDRQSITALIPSILGTILLLLGIFSLAKPHLRKHFMHVAAIIGLLGVLGSAKGLFSLPALLSGAEVVRPIAVIAQSATAVVCLVFLGLCIKSFIDARRRRLAA